MDPDRFRSAYEKLRRLDERYTYKVRPRSSSPKRLGIEQLEARERDLAAFVIGLKEVIDDLFQAIASKKTAAPGDPGGPEA